MERTEDRSSESLANTKEGGTRRPDAPRSSNHEPKSPSTDRRLRLGGGWLPALISGLFSVLVPILLFFFYGQDYIANLVEQRILSELTQKLVKSQTEVSELDKIIKSVDAKYANQLRDLTKTREQTSTALLVSDFMNKVRPTADTKCPAEYSFEGSEKKSDTVAVLFIKCTVKNIGTYPFYLSPVWTKTTATAAFDVENGIMPNGIILPNQEAVGSVKLVFTKEFMRVFHGKFTIGLNMKMKTTNEIVDTLKSSFEDEEVRKTIQAMSEFSQVMNFDLNFP